MFSRLASATLILLVLSALALSDHPKLSLRLSGAEAIKGVDNLKVHATLTNTGEEVLRILNDPKSALSKLPANTFTVTGSNGKSPTFVGIKGKYVLSTAVDAGAFTVLNPGKSIVVEHDLSEAYNFTQPGEGLYNITANSLFYIIDSSNSTQPIYAKGELSHMTNLTGKLAKTHPGLARRATYTGCSDTQLSTLFTAGFGAQTYANAAQAYLESHTLPTTRFTTWFGTFTSTHRATILNHFTLINSHQFLSFSFDCTCTDLGTYAYVYPNTFGLVYLCGAFWNAHSTGTDSTSGTLVHEASHFTINGGTSDWAYGRTAAKALAISNSEHAVFNADSHEYFAENTPALA